MNAPVKHIHEAAGAPSATGDCPPVQWPASAETVAGYLSCCSDTFGQLAAILQSIMDAAADEKPGMAIHIGALAQAGHYIADSFADTSGCWRSEIERDGVSETS